LTPAHFANFDDFVLGIDDFALATGEFHLSYSPLGFQSQKVGCAERGAAHPVLVMDQIIPKRSAVASHGIFPVGKGFGPDSMQSCCCRRRSCQATNSRTSTVSASLLDRRPAQGNAEKRVLLLVNTGDGVCAFNGHFLYSLVLSAAVLLR